MAERNHIKIIMLSGLSGSGKSTVANYVAEHGIPRVHFESLTRTISQIDNLNASGQHTVIVDGISGYIDFVNLKRHYPNSVVSVALLADRHIRVRRMAARASVPLTEKEVYDHDSVAIERDNIGGVIALSDYFLFTNRDLNEIFADIEQLFRKLDLID